MSQQFTNLAQTGLNGSVNSSVTTFVVDDGGVFPSTGDFYLLVDNEIVKCTARTTNTLTVVRAQEGTTADTHPDNSFIKLVLSQASLLDFLGESVQFGGWASRPASANEGARYYATDWDIGWIYESGWSVVHPVYIPKARIISLTGWTALNLGASVWTVDNGVLQITMPQNTGENTRCYYKSLPSAPYTLNLVVRTPVPTLQFNTVGFSLYDGTKFFNLQVLTATGGAEISVDRLNSITSYNANNFRQFVLSYPTMVWLRIVDDNTNWRFSYSLDGQTYTEVYSVARNTHLTPTSVAIHANRVESTANVPSVVHSVYAYWET